MAAIHAAAIFWSRSCNCGHVSRNRPSGAWPLLSKNAELVRYIIDGRVVDVLMAADVKAALIEPGHRKLRSKSPSLR